EHVEAGDAVYAGRGADRFECGAERVGVVGVLAGDEAVRVALPDHHTAEVGGIADLVPGLREGDPLSLPQLVQPSGVLFPDLGQLGGIEDFDVAEGDAEGASRLENRIAPPEEYGVGDSFLDDAAGGADDPRMFAFREDDPAGPHLRLVEDAPHDLVAA